MVNKLLPSRGDNYIILSPIDDNYIILSPRDDNYIILPPRGNNYIILPPRGNNYIILPPRGNNYIILLNIRIMNLPENVWYQEEQRNCNGLVKVYSTVSSLMLHE